MEKNQGAINQAKSEKSIASQWVKKNLEDQGSTNQAKSGRSIGRQPINQNLEDQIGNQST